MTTTSRGNTGVQLRIHTDSHTACTAGLLTNGQRAVVHVERSAEDDLFSRGAHFEPAVRSTAFQHLLGCFAACDVFIAGFQCHAAYNASPGLDPAPDLVFVVLVEVRCRVGPRLICHFAWPAARR